MCIGPNGIWARAPLEAYTGAYVKCGCRGGREWICSKTGTASKLPWGYAAFPAAEWCDCYYASTAR
ncbi:unnamed protein product [Prunus armeniaca]